VSLKCEFKSDQCEVVELFADSNYAHKGAHGSVVVEALWYKPEGHGIASR
jgi:hypothetical protein